MNPLDVGKELPRKQIAMPPLPPEEPTAPEATHESTQQVIQEAAQADTVAHEEVPAPQAQVSTQQQAPERETAQAKNFRELRQQAEKAQRERDEFEKRYRELETKVSQADEFKLNPDDLVEGKHLAQVLKEQKELKKQLAEFAQQRQYMEMETRLKQKYPDFDSVVNAENIKTLHSMDPDAVAGLQAAASNPEAALALAYKSIKFNGIVKDIPKDIPQASEESDKIQKNTAKPRPLNTVSAQNTADSPISRMNAFASGKLTPEMRKQLWAETNESRKGY